MNKSQLIKRIASETRCSTSVVSRIVETMLDTITDEISHGEKVVLSGFGTFDTVVRKEKIGRNVRAGEPVVIPQYTHPVFRCGSNLKRVCRKEVEDD